MQQFTKVLDQDDNCFKYFYKKFPSLKNEKIKVGVFHYPQIRQIMYDQQFILEMKRKKRSASEAFTEVVRYNKLVENNLLKFVKKLLVNY